MAGKHVLVIGGGSAAMDVARSARRLGSEVTVMTLESEGRLPAQRIEVEEAVEEGVNFVSGAMLQQAEAVGGKVDVNSIRVEFTPGDMPGVFSAEPISGSEFKLTVDTIVPAIGQDADLARWANFLAADGSVIGTDETWQTSQKGVFAGGDLASMSRFVTEAVGMGKQAARAIASHLVEGLSTPEEDVPADVSFDRINTAYQETHRHTPQQTVDVSARLTNFDEVQRALTADEAQREAARCFSCGTCIYCDNCYFYCPDHGDLEAGERLSCGCGLLQGLWAVRGRVPYRLDPHAKG